MARNIHPSIRNSAFRAQAQKVNPNAHFNDLFEQFVQASTFRAILGSFYKLCDALEIKPGTEFRVIYPQFKVKLTSWKAQSLWTKIDKRAQNREYKKGRASPNTRVFIIGCGPCGLRTAIESALLGAKTVVIEKRDRFSRNNVLHLWPFTIVDLKNLGAKIFYGKFCAGSIDHIAIRQLQCILLKIALIVGVQVYENVEFLDLVEPGLNPPKNSLSSGWRAKVNPADHPVTQFAFDVIIGADGRRNTLDGTYTGGNPFPRKEFRGKLAIAITANFINYNTQEEARVEEISGVAFIFNQKFFQDLKAKTGIDLENIVYYKDETHYFVMTAKKQSLIQKGVITDDISDTVSLLSRENVNQAKLLDYAKEAADFSTNYKMPRLEFAHNHYGQPDVAMFDFTSIYAAENASYVLDRNGHKLLMGLVGDSLLEPFWPTGSGCARGFLGAFDAAWMIRNWSSNNMTPLEVIAERETIYKLLPQVTPENLHKNHNQYSIDPDSRYPNLNKKQFTPEQVRQWYNGGAGGANQNLIVETNTSTLKTPSGPDRQPSVGTAGMQMSKLIHWCKDQVDGYGVEVKDMSTSWKTGLALCAIINRYRPDLLDYDLLNPDEVEQNNQIAFEIAEKELGIPPEMNGAEMANCDVPDRLTVTSYLTKFYELLKNEPAVVRRGQEDEGSRAKKPRGLEPRLGDQRVPASLANHEFLVGTQRPDVFKSPTSMPTSGSAPKVGNVKPRVSILKSFTDSITKKKKNAELTSEAENEATQGMEDTNSEDICGNKLKEADIRMDSRGKSKVSSLAANLQKQFDRQQGRMDQAPDLPAKRVTGRPPTGKPPVGPSQGSGTEVCYFCNTRVYVMERLSAEGLFFHRGCLRCDYCNTLLRLGNYAFERDPLTGRGHFYCVQHMGMKKQHLTRKRSITNTLGLRDQPAPIITVTRERISVGAQSPLGSPTSEYLPSSPNGFGSPSRTMSPTSELLSPTAKPRGSPERASFSTPERIEFSYSTTTGEEEEEEDTCAHNLHASLERGLDSKMEDDEEEAEDEEEDDEEESSSEESSSEEETSSEDDEDEASDEEDDEEDEEEAVAEEDEEEAVAEEDEDVFDEESSKVETCTDSAMDVAKPCLSQISQEINADEGDSPSKAAPEAGLRESSPASTAPEKTNDAESISSSSTESSFTISTPSKKPSLESSTSSVGDKMEFDDQEIMAEVASIEEPSSRELPSPPFPIKQSHGVEKSSQSPSRESPTHRSPSPVAAPKSRDDVSPSSDGTESGGRAKESSPNESPSHYLPPAHLLSANKAKLAQMDSPSFQQQFMNLPLKKAKDNMKRISLTEEELRKMKDVSVPKPLVEPEGAFPAEKGRKKVNADAELTMDLKESPAPTGVSIPFVDDESESESESILDKSRRDDSASEQGSPAMTHNNSPRNRVAPTSPPKRRAPPPPTTQRRRTPEDSATAATTPQRSSASTTMETTPPAKENHEDLRLMQSAKQERLRREAREKARMKTDDEYGITPVKFAKGGRAEDRRVEKNDSIYEDQETSAKDRDEHKNKKMSTSASSGQRLLDKEKSSKRRESIPSSAKARDSAASKKLPRESTPDRHKIPSKSSSAGGRPSTAATKPSSDAPAKRPEKSDQLEPVRRKKDKKGKENSPADAAPPPEKKRMSFLELLGIKNSPPNQEKKKAKNEKPAKKEKKSLATVNKFTNDISNEMNRLNLNKDRRGPSGKGVVIPGAPRATMSDEFASSSDEWDVNSNGGSVDSQELLGEELDKRTLRRIQRAARQQQKQQEQKRLRIAQELQRHMEEVEVKQRELEARGVAVEMILRGEGDDGSKSEAELMQEWFNLVYEKNVLVRYESELMVRAKELELEDRHGRLQTSLREKMIIAEEDKTAEDRNEEERLLEEMLDVVEQRDALVALLEEDRVREQEEDNNLFQLMRSKGYQLSPLSYQLGDIS